MSRSMVWTVVCALVSSRSLAAEVPLVWPQFRGPGGSGVADDQKPPLEFGPEKNVKWKTAIPGGFSSPIVAGNLLALTAFDGGKLFTIAYDRGTGKERWRAEAPAAKIEAFHATEGSPAASTPVTDGTRIVSYFGSCGLFCYDLAGKEQWRVEMPMAKTLADFGTGVSPILVDGVVVLVRDQSENPKIVAVDAKTGKPLWETKRQSIGSHSTPTVSKASGGYEVITPGVGRMIAYDLKTGSEKWWVNGMPAMCCASPVVEGDRLFHAAWSPGEDFTMPEFDSLLQEAGDFAKGYLTKEGNDKTAMKGFFESNDPNHDGRITREEWDGMVQYISQSKNSAFAVRLGGSGNVTESHVMWRKPKAKGLPYVPSIINYRGQFVMVKDGGIVTTYDAATGEELSAKRSVASGRYYSSPVAANGFIYMTSLDEGTVTVLKAGEKTPRAVATNELKERIAATPAIADDTLYVRTATTLYAFGEK